MDSIYTLIVGSGLAGLYQALQAADHGRVVLVTKACADAGSTTLAQGGVAAVLSDDDAVEQHVRDTLEVGAGLCRPAIVAMTAEEGPRHVRALAAMGVAFSQTPSGAFDLAREGGHRQRRVAHVADTTGRAIQQVLLAQARAHPNVTIIEHAIVTSLIVGDDAAGVRCCGAGVVFSGSLRTESLLADHTVLATGGLGQAYPRTTNPTVATGDGVALAYRAGAEVTNLEFVQFHPTLLSHPDAGGFLISEALRGEGGILRRSDGRDLMAGVHEMGSLAPRDVVAAAIERSMHEDGQASVWLDMTGVDGVLLARRFPAIFARCLELGIDLRVAPIPVAPGAHYACGGVETDGWGRTSIANLWAIGECAHTGLHGACRLASNSLLEALVFAERAARAAREDAPAAPGRSDVPDLDGPASDAERITALFARVQTTMSRAAGIVRSDRGLACGLEALNEVREEIERLHGGRWGGAALESLRNLALVAQLVVASAMLRRETRGLHRSTDWPTTSQEARDTTLRRGVVPSA